MQKLPGQSLLLPALRLHPCLTATPKQPSRADLAGRGLEPAVSALRCLPGASVRVSVQTGPGKAICGAFSLHWTPGKGAVRFIEQFRAQHSKGYLKTVVDSVQAGRLASKDFCGWSSG